MDYPKLANDFFKQFKPAEDWLARELSQRSQLYHSSFAPLCQWEEITYIGCSHKDLIKINTLTPQQVVVLTEASALANYWQNFCVKFTQNKTSSSKPPPPPPSPLIIPELKNSLSLKPESSSGLIIESHPVENLGQKVNNSLYAGYLTPYRGAMFLKIHQDRAMVIEISGTGTEEIIPSQINETLLISEPGPFKIVSRTLKEYHGPIFNCPSLESYFKNTLHLEYPRSMTIIPFLDNDKLVALYCSWSQASHLSLDLLKILQEQIISTIISTIESEPVLKIS